MFDIKSSLVKGLEIKNTSLSQVLNYCADNENENSDVTNPISTINLSPYVDKTKLIHNLSKKIFTIMTLNIQSLTAKFDEFNILIKELESHNCEPCAIVLQETWLSEQADLSLFQLDNYNIISQGYTVSRHGGLTIYLKKEYNYDHVKVNFKNDLFECMFLKVMSQRTKKKLILGNIYRPPRNGVNEIQLFSNNLSNILEAFKDLHAEIVLGGDFNLNLLEVNHKRYINDFYNDMCSNSFFPKITLPTRITDHSATLIDNFFYKLSPLNQTSTAFIYPTEMSDHFPCFLGIDLHSRIFNPHPEYVYVVDKSEKNIKKVKEELVNLDLLSVLNKSPHFHPNKNYECFITNLTDVVSKYISPRKIKFNKAKHKKNSWITKGLIKSINYRDKLYRNLKLFPPESDEYKNIKTNLKTFNLILKRNIRLAKLSYYHYCFENSKNNIKATWENIRNILCNNCNKNKKGIDTMIINGKISSNKTEIADFFNHYFVNIGPPLSSRQNLVKTDNYQNFLKTPLNTKFCFKNINNMTVLKTIESLNSKHSSGYDGISTAILKQLRFEVNKPLTILINQTFNTGIFPDKLKIAKVIPLFKTGDKQLFVNYRPISLLPAVSKVYEKIMYDQIYAYLENNNILYKSQYGFRNKHSTELASLELTDQIVNNMEKKQVPFAIFMDLSKAFDTLNHEILLTKFKYYGIYGTSLNLLESYLKNRFQFVSLNNTNSKYNLITSGVPQGSILGPLMFLIYINDLPLASNKFKFINFADDTTLLSNLNDFNSNFKNQDIGKNINEELSKIIFWLESNGLTINKQKTKFMLFHNKGKKFLVPTIIIEDIKIELVENFNFLGLLINKQLSWEGHLYNISNKISKIIGIMSKIKYFVPKSCLMNLYTALIMPHINYCILVWGHTNKKIFKLQKKAIRIINLAPFICHTDPLFKSSNLLKVNDIYKLNQMKFLYKLVNNTLPLYFNTFTYISGSDVHHYLTRSNHKLRNNVTKSEFARKTIRYMLPSVHNSVPKFLFNKFYTFSWHSIAAQQKEIFLVSYPEACTLNNCYSCNKYFLKFPMVYT